MGQDAVYQVLSKRDDWLTSKEVAEILGCRQEPVSRLLRWMTHVEMKLVNGVVYYRKMGKVVR